MTTNLDITDKVAVYASKYRIPFIHDVPQFAEAGLAIYGPDFEDIFRMLPFDLIQLEYPFAHAAKDEGLRGKVRASESRKTT